jgi:hypothetical protein
MEDHMVDTTVPYQIVIFTQRHSISGGIFLRDLRFSDFINDRRETNIMLRNANVARLENPAKVLEKTQVSFIPKSGVVLAFEPPQKVPQPPQRYIKYPKEKYEVFFITDGMEVHGNIHMQGTLDLLHVLANPAQSFLPITQATVSIEANPNLLLKQETVLVNTQYIRFIGEVQTKSPTEPRP